METRVSKPQKRGRPRKTASGEDGQVQARRARMRRAQEAFRNRQKAAHEAEKHLVTKQEDAIEQMTSAFVEFVDFLVHSRPRRMDRDLMRKLHETIGRFVDANDSKESAASASVIMVPDEMSMSSEHKAPKDGGGQQHGSNSDDIPSFSTSPAELSIAPLLDSTFGNGWPDHLPNSFIMLDDGRKHSAGDTSAFVRRLVHHTLNVGYQILLGSTDLPQGLAARVFAFSLLFHSREEVMFNLRWFLGPGRDELVRLGFVSFANGLTPKTDDFATVPSLLPAVDVYAVDTVRMSVVGTDTVAPFLNAREVEQYLHEKGARFLDADTIEIPVPDSPGSTQAAEHFEDILPSVDLMEYQTSLFSDPSGVSTTNLPTFIKSNDQSSSLPYHGYLHTEDTGFLKSLKYRVQTSALFQNLAYISVCLSKAPAYRRHDIDHAIFLSTVGMGFPSA